MSSVVPARISIAQPVLDRIRRRLDDSVIPPPPDDDPGDWRYGIDVRWLSGLRDYWLSDYDWRAVEAELNTFPQFRCEIDGLSIHFLHLRAHGGGYPLILTHGWPGSVVEFLVAGPLLAEAGFDVVLPSLPGYGFSGRPPRPIGPSVVARAWRRLMVEGLGYSRFGAQGGDMGSAVTRWLGYAHADVVDAIHLNLLHLTLRAGASPAAEQWSHDLERLLGQEGAYSIIQTTKPQTIGFALADSPLGYAGWIIEKCRAWSDCGGDVESVFSKRDLITNAMTYIATGNVDSAVWMYNALTQDDFSPAPVLVPTGFAAFPEEFILPPPKSVVEQEVALTRWTDMPRGGHFAAWEQPRDFAAEVADFFRSLSPPAKR